MRLTVKNLGPIKDGHLDLHQTGLVILTGPNNAGKSYLTYLIHGISQYLDLSGKNNVYSNIIKLYRNSDVINSAIDAHEPIDLFSAVEDRLPALTALVNDIISNNITKIFAASIPGLECSVEFGAELISAKNDSLKYVVALPDGVQFTTVDGTVYKDDFETKYFKDVREQILSDLLAVTSVFLEGAARKRTYFFPAERTAINLFAKHIVSTKAELKDEFDSGAITTLSDEELGRQLRAQLRAAPKYPYAIRDYINFVNSFKPSDKESEFAEIANKMELLLIGGKVHLDNFDQLVFTPNGSETPLELHLSSSLVKSLSYFILYLRYTAKKGDQVIIDEPELNLHPDIQIAITRIITEIVNNGIKVIISTHSDYLIKELNNIILIGELYKRGKHEAFIAEKGYSDDELLYKEHVKGYFIQDGLIQSINLEEDGLVVPTINDAIRRVDGLAEEIFMEMEG